MIAGLIDWMVGLGEPYAPADLMALQVEVEAGRVTLSERERRILATAGGMIAATGDRIISDEIRASVREIVGRLAPALDPVTPDPDGGAGRTDRLSGRARKASKPS